MYSAKTCSDGHDKNLRILRFESEIRVELSHLIIEIFDLRTTLIPGRHTNSVKEWKLEHAILREERRDFVAIGYHRKKFQQQCLGVGHRMSLLMRRRFDDQNCSVVQALDFLQPDYRPERSHRAGGPANSRFSD